MTLLSKCERVRGVQAEIVAQDLKEVVTQKRVSWTIRQQDESEVSVKFNIAWLVNSFAPSTDPPSVRET